MFRALLFATTALLAVATIAPSGARKAITTTPNLLAASNPTKPPIINSGKDSNSEFLCTYGGYEVSYYHESSSSFFDLRWRHIAVPIEGKGKTVSEIIVENYADPLAEVTVGIYSNTSSGVPGNVLVKHGMKARKLCERHRVHIQPILLNAGEKYWIEESVVLYERLGKKSVSWAIDPNSRQDAYSQYHSAGWYVSSSYHSYTSPWKSVGSAAFVRVR